MNARTADIPLNSLGKLNTVKLPRDAEYKNNPDNFVPARNRLLSLLKRLSKNLEQLKRYDSIKDEERDGVIETKKEMELSNLFIIAKL